MTSFSPPTPVSLLDITSIRQPFRSANLLYIRNSSPANSAASSPPVPARISSMTFFSSFGSFGMSRTFSSASRASRLAPSDFSSVRARSRMSASPAPASSSVCAMSLDDRLVLAEALDERLDLGQRLGVLPVLRRLALHFARAEQPHQLLVALFFRRQLIEHIGFAVVRRFVVSAFVVGERRTSEHERRTSLSSDTGGRNAISSPSLTGCLIRA